MTRLAPLAAARARPIAPALRRPLLRVSPRRIILGAAAALAALGVAYAIARETPLFAVQDFELLGARGAVAREVRHALAELEGTSLVKLDRSELERRLVDLPSVADAAVDRSFPHTVRVLVNPERPLAVVRARGVAWLVSVEGRVIRALELQSAVRLPRIWTPSATELAPGESIDVKARVPLRALASVPARFPARIRTVRGDADDLIFILAGGTELRLGSSEDLRAKLASAQAVLSGLPRPERRELAYLDVSLPQRVVGGEDSQLESEG